MTDTANKLPTSASPLLERTKALLDRVRAYGGAPNTTDYQLTRPLDGDPGHPSPSDRPSVCRIAVPEFVDEL